MSVKHEIKTGFEEAPPHVSKARRFLKVFFSRIIVVFGSIVILAMILMAIFAPFIAPYQPDKIDMANGLLQPNRHHLLGTDFHGRDTLSRVIFGTRISLLIGIAAVSMAAIIGMGLGLLAGYIGGITNAVIMRLIDALMAFPGLLLTLIIAAMLGSGLRNVIFALSVGIVPMFARLTRGQVISLIENDYILAGRAMGASNLRIMLAHLLPNCFPVLIVAITMMVGMTILAEAGLSFLGAGVPPPTPTWGSMVSDGYRYLSTNPLLSLAPGLAVMLLVFAFNMVGDGLRDALDPRLRGIL
jgi:ABC-type dipeptide/oligopeptide/nickel transport system permease subunit